MPVTQIFLQSLGTHLKRLLLSLNFTRTLLNLTSLYLSETSFSAAAMYTDKPAVTRRYGPFEKVPTFA